MMSIRGKISRYFQWRQMNGWMGKHRLVCLLINPVKKQVLVSV